MLLLLFQVATASTLQPMAQNAPQDSSAAPIFYEPLPDGQHVFYFDEYYYLSDKFCTFTVIERIGRFDPATDHFDGKFEDYTIDGRRILTGFYDKGRKSGLFRAFHPNGQVKWEGQYTNDLPDGEWHYYYPDGRPMLKLRYENDSTMQIVGYWDRRGRERVKDGQGRYEMKVEIDGYSEYGAVFINRIGRIHAGQPTGEWTLELVYENGEKETLGTERYRRGDPRPEENEQLDQILRGATRYALVPLTRFLQAEEMKGRPCSIDHHSGFIDYLRFYLEDWFQDYMDEEIVPQELVFQIFLNKDGTVSELVPETTFTRTRSAQMLMQALRNVGYWIPSFLNGEYIHDELTLRFQVFPDRENDKLLFLGVDISRKHGF